MTIGERVGWYRRRRGMSQKVLANLIGRTEDWLNKIENNRIQLDRISVIQSLAKELDISIGDLMAEPTLMDANQSAGKPTVPALREALLSYAQLMPFTMAAGREIPPMAQLDGRLKAVWDAYQATRFAYVSATLPELISDLDYASRNLETQDVQRANLMLATAYHAAATVLTKVGEVDLAWVAAQKGFDIAQNIGEPVVWLSLARSVTHVTMSTGRHKDAAKLVQQVASHTGPIPNDASPEYLSVYGTLFLAGAMAAARSNDRSLTTDYLNEADAIATRLGRDANYFWTAFGPTNVDIHRVSTAMELDDVETALSLGPGVDTSPLPTERQVRHSLEIARAHNARGRKDQALDILLSAEARAPEQVRHHGLCRDLVVGWVRTSKTRPGPALSGLAERMKLV
ncbi:helix-turn-helix domain-containing protein [Nocardia sp. BMG111209]|uniref:helix-turn-helix domain-containing protein n=1 Tax=Nocardia sp. BMG111209 TaxID=1160137 RepID=UPI0018CB6EB0|nr:helix-turn-helix transcriptional regulator [Nocardia sp. BMG111209]